MYYISSVVDDKYGITDTKDGVEEFYDARFIYDNFKSLEIKGVSISNNNIRISVWSPLKEYTRQKIICL